jgi:L,D-transpeptidase catalytic domain
VAVVSTIFRFGLLASLAAVSCLVLSFGVSGSAAAGPRQGESPANTEEPAPLEAPLFFVISLSKQQVSVYTPKGLYTQSPVSTGQPGHPTPMGIFTILGKELYHESNIYSGAPMPFMQRITYTGVAMHEGYLPGYPASHGCIRMPREFARWLFRITAGNERVVITQQDIVPVEIAHPKLLAPKFMAVGLGDTTASGFAQVIQNALTEARGSAGATIKRDFAIKPNDEGNAPASALNPLDFAKVMRARAAKRLEEAEAAIEPARQAADLKARRARAVALEYRKAEIALAAGKERFELADRILKRATGDEAIKAATVARDAAEVKLDEAKAALETAMQVKTQQDQEAETAARAVKEADSNRRSAADAIKTWNRRLAPLSIFISRKTQRLYVRQDYVKVFDLPITIREPEKPIGTHLFIAVPKETVASAPDRGLRWLVLTLPEGAPNEDEIGTRRGGRVNVVAPAKVAPPTASETLDRIEMPDEVAEKLSEMLWAGAALIVSDNEMSHETTDFARTDFVVLTGASGGFSTSSGERPSSVTKPTLWRDEFEDGRGL